MNFKKIAKALLFPHIAVLILLLPLATALLTYSMLTLEENDPVRLASYIVAFYTLTVLCVRIPKIIRLLRNIKNKNKFVNAWTNDPRLRINVTLVGNVLWNGSYAALQLGMGIYHRSSWFCSLAAYYASLAAIRLMIVRHTLRHKPGERPKKELKYYKSCGIVFLIMNSALSGMMFYMIYENRAVHHHEITTIAMSAYTFTAFTLAIINVIRYRKYHSPALSAAKAVSLAAACVSVLTLENTMLTTFGGDMPSQTRKLFLTLSGGAVSLFIIAAAIYMIARSNGKIKTED